MGCKANPREKRVMYRTADYWKTKDDKCNNKLMATKKLSKEPEQTKHKKN